jgi:hypothetical protein
MNALAYLLLILTGLSAGGGLGLLAALVGAIGLARLGPRG